MATKDTTIELLLQTFAALPRLTAKKMFGEYCLYLNAKPVALVCDDCLFVKITPPGRELLAKPKEGTPYPGAKPHFAFKPKTWGEQTELISELLQVTYQALPAPKPKKKK